MHLNRPVTSNPAADLVATWPAAPGSGKAGWLRARLVDAIHDGSLPAHTRLPGARALAAAVGVSRGTVDTVYAQLADEGFLHQAPRRRSVVAERSGGAPKPIAPPTSAAPPPTPGVPDPALFPHRAWAAATRAALGALSARDLGYPDPAGHPRLRAVLADWLSRTRGVRTTPDTVHVTAGVSHALSLLAQVLGAPTWAVEKPCSVGAVHLLRRVVTTVDVPIDDDGLLPALLPDRAGAVLVSPTHQYPTGRSMGATRRRELVEMCRQAGRWVVEDDYDSHLGTVPAAVQAFAPDTVVLVGSLSKLLSPGLRLGWIVAPDGVAERLRELRQQTDLGVSVPMQLAVAELITSGALDRHLHRVRTEYGRRRTRLVDALAPLSLTGSAVGVHAFVRSRQPARLVDMLAGAGIPSAVVDDDRWPGAVVSVAAYR
jgi:GntR family transcriptional regulator/MocR family aminotransferase